MGNDITSLVEFLEPEGEEVEIYEETGTEVKPEENEDESDKSTETPEDESGEDEEKEESEESTDEDKKTEGEDGKEEVADPLSDIAEQNRELRQILRQQKKDMVIMQSKLDRLGKKAVTTKTDEEELFGKDESKEAEQELSEVELVQNELTQLAQTKSSVLDTLVEIMELNPKYEDVRQVCSQSNFADMFNSVGEAIAEKEGTDSTLAAMQAELAVWRMPNPYKYMYGLIKKYHPSYVTKEEEKEVKPKETKPKKTPTSLANVPGKSVADNKWTSARIDEMPETELDTVPEDIYEKYLAGDLD